MTLSNGNGAFDAKFGALVSKLALPILTAIIFGLLGVVWTLINGQMGQLRQDIAVLQTKNEDQSKAFERLAQRVADLISTLNDQRPLKK
jgi:hypothetical protein